MPNQNAILENFGSGNNAVAHTASAVYLDGVDDEIIFNLDSVSVTYLEFWVKKAAGEQELLIINDGGTGETIKFSAANAVVQTGFTGFSSTMQEGTIEDGKWFKIRFDFDAITVDQIKVGTDGSGLGEIYLAEIAFLNYIYYTTGKPTESDGRSRFIIDESGNNGPVGILVGSVVRDVGLSGLENGETHNGLPQRLVKNYNNRIFFNGNYVLDFDQAVSFGTKDWYIEFPVVVFENTVLLGRIIDQSTGTPQIRIGQNTSDNTLLVFIGEDITNTSIRSARYSSDELQFGRRNLCRVEFTNATGAIDIYINGVLSNGSYLQQNASGANITNVRYRFSNIPSVVEYLDINNEHKFTEISGFEDQIGSAVVTEINPGSKKNTITLENPLDLGNDLFGLEIQSSIKSAGGTQKFFNGGYAQGDNLDEAKTEPFTLIGFINVFEPCNLFDSRHGSGEGKVISIDANRKIKVEWFGATGKLELVSQTAIDYITSYFLSIVHSGGGEASDFEVKLATPAGAISTLVMDTIQNDLGIYTPSKNIRLYGNEANTALQARLWYGEFALPENTITEFFNERKALYQ